MLLFLFFIGNRSLKPTVFSYRTIQNLQSNTIQNQHANELFLDSTATAAVEVEGGVHMEADQLGEEGGL